MTSRDLINRLINPLGYRLEKKSKDRLTGQDLHHDIDIILGRKSGYFIFDLGGNEGQSIRHFLKDFREPLIVSFEPSRHNSDLLEKKYHEHPRVRIVPAAVGEAEGEGELNICERSEMNSLLPLESDLQAIGADLQIVAKERVKIHSLDTFLIKNPSPQIDLLKMDCQGSEMAILRGARQLLTQRRIKCIYLEVMFKPLYQNQATLKEYIHFLEPYGFDLTGFYRPALRHTALFHCDVLFTRRDEPAGSGPIII